MNIHYLRATRENLHGTFSRDHDPVLTIDPGDIVRYQTLDAGWHVGEPGKDPDAWLRFADRDPELDAGHAMNGPISIRGAEPGDTLAIHIHRLVPSGWGFTDAGGTHRQLNVKLGLGDDHLSMYWKIDTRAMQATNQFGHSVGLKPFLGVMGVAPDLPGLQRTGPPRAVGGNIDCKELVAGSTLFLPVEVEGALFSTGDGHATQADGEVSGTAIECGMDLAELSFEVIKDKPISTPRALTQDAWMTFGFNEDLDEAMFIALDAMLDLMSEFYDLDRPQAMALSSLVVDLRITQVVNGSQGVHAVLKHGSLG